MKYRKHIFALACIVVLGGLISASSLAMAAPRPRPGEATPESVEDLRETLKLVMLSRLKRELHLSPEQERAVLPLLDELEQSRQEMRHQRHRAMYDLRRLLQADADEGQIEARLLETRTARRAFENKRQHIEEEIAGYLSPRQQAHLLVFMQEFSRRLRHQLERIRRQAGAPGGRRGRQGPPPEEDFWDEDLP